MLLVCTFTCCMELSPLNFNVRFASMFSRVKVGGHSIKKSHLRQFIDIFVWTFCIRKLIFLVKDILDIHE